MSILFFVLLFIGNVLSIMHLPADVIGNIATYIRFETDRHTFAILSRSCNIAMQPHQQRSRGVLSELCYLIRHITPQSLRADYGDIHKIATELINIQHPLWFRKLPRLIRDIESSSLSDRDKFELYGPLNLHPVDDFVASTHRISANISDEIRILIAASQRIFQTLRDQTTGVERCYNAPGYRYYTKDLRPDSYDWKVPRNTPPWSTGCATIYERLIPHFKNLSLDQQHRLVTKYQFVPWSSSVVDSIKQRSSTYCDGFTEDSDCFADVVASAYGFSLHSRIIHIYTNIKSPRERLLNLLIQQQHDFLREQRELEASRRFTLLTFTAIFMTGSCIVFLLMIVRRS